MWIRGISVAVAVALGLTACEASSSTRAPADASNDLARLPEIVTWPCPVGWVQGASGGCGPSVVLCGPDGGAAEGACASADRDATPFRRGDDGAIQGAWSEPGAVAPPTPEWSPDAGIHACPAGWQLRADQTCDPAVPERCAAGSAPLPGGACTAEELCGSGPWPDPGTTAPGARIVRVRDGASDDAADGSERAPFGSLERAAVAAGRDGVVLVAEGVYPTGLRVEGALTIVGRCASRVVLLGGDADLAETIRVSGRDGALSVRGVTLRGGGTGLFVESPAHATLREALIEGPRYFAAAARGPDAVLLAEEVVVREAMTVVPRIDLAAQMGARLTVRRSSLRGARIRGVIAIGVGGQCVVEDSVVEGGDPGSDQGPYALFAADGATLDAARVVVRRFDGEGVGTSISPGARTRVTLRDVVLRDLRLPPGGVGVSALLVSNSDVDAERVLFEDCTGLDAWAWVNFGSTLSLRDAVFRTSNTRAGSAPAVGITAGDVGGASRVTARGLRIENVRLTGVYAGESSSVDLDDSEVVPAGGAREFQAFSAIQAGAQMHLRRVRVADLHATAIVVQAPGARATLEDSLLLWASDAGAVATGDILPTVLVTSGGALVVARTRVSNAPALGAVADGERTTLRLEGSIVEHVTTTRASEPGIGLLVSRGADAVVVRSRVEDARVCAAATDGATVRVEDSVLRGTASPSDPAGVGALLRTGARGVLLRSLVERNDAFGVALLDDGTSLLAEDLFVRQMRGARVVRGRVLDEAILGVGFVATQGTAATLRRVAVTDARGAALLAAITTSQDGGVTGTGAATLDAEDIFVRGVAPASLGTGTGEASGPAADGIAVGEAGVASTRRALLEDGLDGVETYSRSTTLERIVAVRQRACGLVTGVGVKDSPSLARAVTVVASERTYCLHEGLGDFRIPVTGL